MSIHPSLKPRPAKRVKYRPDIVLKSPKFLPEHPHIRVPRGSENGRAGGVHSGPSGKRATRFYQGRRSKKQS